MASTIVSKNKTCPNSEFRLVADGIVALAQDYNVNLQGYSSVELPLFSALSAAKQKLIIESMKLFLSTLQQVVGAGASLDDGKQTAWHAISFMGLRPPAGLFTHLQQGTVLEIYDLNNFQIWRNFEFLRVSSYTLEEIYCIDVFSRYYRPPSFMQECVEKVTLLIKAEAPEIFFPDISEHALTETVSRDKLVIMVKHHLFALLKDRTGQPAAWFVMSSGEVTKGPKKRMTPVELEESVSVSTTLFHEKSEQKPSLLLMD